MESQQFWQSKENNSKSSSRNCICFDRNLIWSPSQKKTFFAFLHWKRSCSSIFNKALSQGKAYSLVCVALRYFCWQGFGNKSSVWPCMPDRWCREKRDEPYSLKHCRRQVCLLLINLKLSCWALVCLDITSQHCWSLDRWASFDINSHNAHSAHINNLFLLPLSPARHATVGIVPPGHKVLLNFPRYLCALISICGWQACEQTPTHIVGVAGHGHWPQRINT